MKKQITVKPAKSAAPKIAKGPAMINFFPGYIGQENIVGECNEILSLEKVSRVRPLRALLFKGQQGLGKTHFAGLIGEAREKIHTSEHRFLELNASGLTRAQLIKYLMDNCHGKPATIFIDEAHMMKPEVRNIMKSVLETGGVIKDVRLSDQAILEVNPFLHQFIFASNQDCAAADPALFGAQGSRTLGVTFIQYSVGEKKALIKRMMELEGMKIDSAAVDYIENHVYANARAIMMDLRDQLPRKAEFHGGHVTLDLARAFCAGELHHVRPEERHTVSRYPMGLQWVDIQTLQFLGRDTKGRLVGEIGQHCNSEPGKETSYRLQCLCALGFTQTLNNGRKALAPGGAEYLNLIASNAAKAKVRVERASGKPTGKATVTPSLTAPKSSPVPHKAPQTPAKVPAAFKASESPAPAKATVSPTLAKLASEAGLIPATV